MADYVIVGAGSAGCVLADRLSADPATSVLVLEAGGSDRRMEITVPAAFSKLFQTEVDWNYATAPQPHLDGRSVYWPRGKVLGGSSSLNAMMVVPGDRADYDGWAATGADGWGFADVSPYFARVDGALPPQELRDPNPLSRAFVAAAAEVEVEATLTRVWQRRGRRLSAAGGYLRRARRRPNLEVVLHAHVTRVVVENGRAVGVAYRAAGEEHLARADREVLLCAGAVNSPQLLLLSGIGAPDELRRLGIDPVAELPGVGRNLQDHLAAGIWVESLHADTLLAAESRRNALRFLLTGRGMLTSSIAEAYAFVRTGPGLPAPDLELLFAPVMFVDGGLTPPPRHAVTLAAVLLQPRSRGRVFLRSSDPLEPPLIEANYLADPDDLRVLVDGIRLARRIAAAPALAAVLGDELPPGAGAQTDEEIAAVVRGLAQTLYHPVGTCRMGVDDLAVVDPQLRVRGIEALRVADASVMPTVVRGHTNAPTLMIAEKASDLIRDAPFTHAPAASAILRSTTN